MLSCAGVSRVAGGQVLCTRWSAPTAPRPPPPHMKTLLTTTFSLCGAMAAVVGGGGATHAACTFVCPF